METFKGKVRRIFNNGKRVHIARSHSLCEIGNEILDLLKAKPIDEDVVSVGMMSMEELRTNFDDKMQELTGTQEEMPWQKGAPQFSTPSLNFDLNKFIPQKNSDQQEVNPVGESNPQPSP